MGREHKEMEPREEDGVVQQTEGTSVDQHYVDEGTKTEKDGVRSGSPVGGVPQRTWKQE